MQRCGKKANVIPAAFPEPRGEVGEGPGSRTAEEGAGAEGRLQGLRGVSLEGDRAESCFQVSKGVPGRGGGIVLRGSGAGQGARG